jgi:hypothetical protein
LKGVREPLLGPLHNHILYQTPVNRLDVTLAPILLRFVMLLVGHTGSPRVRETMQAIFVMESRENDSVGVIWYIGEALMVGESRT